MHLQLTARDSTSAGADTLGMVQFTPDFVAQQPLDQADYLGMLGAVLEDYPEISEIPETEQLIEFLVRCNFNLHNLGLIPLVAQLNHSCCANLTVTEQTSGDEPLAGIVTVEVERAHLHCQAAEMSRICMQVRTVCEVTAQTELCISYLTDKEGALPTAARKRLLKRWGFDCICSKCDVGEATAGETSALPDAKRAKAL